MTDIAVLPIPIQFELPNSAWQRVNPRDYDIPNAAFMAVRPDRSEAYTPVITISGGFRRDTVTLDEIADESIDVLRSDVGNAALVKRREAGSENVPAVLQLLEADAKIDGQRFDLQQAQVVEAIIDVNDKSKRIVLIFTMTGTYAQTERLASEFEDFMDSVVILPGVE
ncbi:MAG: hypothetical protein ACRDPS_11980 [Nocardioides sp.]|uniref:hypothetical protein n=1 Tax=Nocardioides sp. TaxID=35761 RepID=UPI003D6A2A0E